MYSKGKKTALYGLLDLLVLKTLTGGPTHGYGIERRIAQTTGDVFHITPGSLFRCLHRMEETGWLRGAIGTSENNRSAKFYELSNAGRRKLNQEMKNWAAITNAVTKVLEST